MVTRDTSKSAYDEIKKNGNLNEWAWLVYDALFRSGPMTQNETWKMICDEQGCEIKKDSVGPRFAELCALGILTDKGKRACRTNGIKCHVYDVTSKLPNGSKRKPKREFWHVVVKRKDDPSQEGVRIEHTAETAEKFAKGAGERFIEIIHLREVFD